MPEESVSPQALYYVVTRHQLLAVLHHATEMTKIQPVQCKSHKCHMCVHYLTCLGCMCTIRRLGVSHSVQSDVYIATLVCTSLVHPHFPTFATASLLVSAFIFLLALSLPLVCHHHCPCLYVSTLCLYLPHLSHHRERPAAMRTTRFLCTCAIVVVRVIDRLCVIGCLAIAILFQVLGSGFELLWR